MSTPPYDAVPRWPDNARRLNAGERVDPRSRQPESWTSQGCRVSVMTREDAGVDCDSPWIASCDTHSVMIGCDTKAQAKRAARARGEWCHECQQLSH